MHKIQIHNSIEKRSKCTYYCKECDIEGNIWFKSKDVLKTLRYNSIDKFIYN